jgi:FAD/FMN-containing dehydrogenase
VTGYEQNKQRLVQQIRAQGRDIRLNKQTSNLFRDREPGPENRLDVSAFNHVIKVDVDNDWVEVEGMTTYQDLVDATLAHGVMPAVVPQLKSITIGGAVAGIGIESTSFRHGLVHENVLEMEVLTGNGDIVTCTPDNESQDLYYGFPNSYGTLGYVLKLKVRTIPVKRFVKLRHLQYDDANSYFDEVDRWTKKDIDFLDGTAFSPTQLYLSIGTFMDQAPATSDYTFENIYYRSIRDKRVDYLTNYDYIWRWDTDWFWCSKNVFAQNPLIRRIYGRSRLNSIFYTKLMRWNAKYGVSQFARRLVGTHGETVIQDVDIPIQRASEFLEYFDREIGIRPVWICPFKAASPDQQFSLYTTDPEMLYVNFGFWDVVRGRQKRPEGFFNRKVEAKVEELGGIKSLYSDSFYTRDKFWGLYNKAIYDALKTKYDNSGRLKDLYQKCVQRQ